MTSAKDITDRAEMERNLFAPIYDPITKNVCHNKPRINSTNEIPGIDRDYTKIICTTYQLSLGNLVHLRKRTNKNPYKYSQDS